MNNAKWDRLSDLQIGAEQQSDELSGLMEAVYEWENDGVHDPEDVVAQALQKAGEVARTAVEVVGILDELLSEIRKAKGAEA